MSDELLIHHCSPTMAGIKTANLFVCPFESEKVMHEELSALNKKLVPKGLCIIHLRYRNGKALLYMFRPDSLKQDMKNEHATHLLRNMDYPVEESYPHCLRKLISRLNATEDFPHEIGLFLGYPPEDVEGFITLGPKHSKACGCWRVYGDVAAASRKFASYKACTKAYQKAYQNHHRLERLFVSVG